MLIRIGCSITVTVLLMHLVWRQIVAANDDKYLTVEQLVAAGRSALSFDRHFAMPLDFCIVAPVVGLAIFLCAKQWSPGHGVIVAIISVVLILFCVYGLWIGGNEAHVHDGKPTVAGIEHATFAAIAVWGFIMVLAFTPAPEPVLLLALCIIVPAFFFVGTHMFLGMINFAGAASSFNGKALTDPVGWAVIVVATGLVWWRSYTLIPTSFWESLK